MTIRVHTISGAPRGWRVLVGLAIKGLDWEIKLLNASTQEHKSPSFLKINPRGTVPVLEANGQIIRDSLASLAWLDRAYPEHPRLFGTTSDEAASIWQLTTEMNDYLRNANHELLSKVFRPSQPERGTEDYDAMKKGAEAMHEECTWLEGILSNQTYLAGENPSAVDAIAFPELCLVQRAVETKQDLMDRLSFGELSSLYPKVTAWKTRTAKLTGMEQTMPPHWNE